MIAFDSAEKCASLLSWHRRNCSLRGIGDEIGYCIRPKTCPRRRTGAFGPRSAACCAETDARSGQLCLPGGSWGQPCVERAKEQQLPRCSLLGELAGQDVPPHQVRSTCPCLNFGSGQKTGFSPTGLKSPENLPFPDSVEASRKRSISELYTSHSTQRALPSRLSNRLLSVWQ